MPELKEGYSIRPRPVLGQGRFGRSCDPCWLRDLHWDVVTKATQWSDPER